MSYLRFLSMSKIKHVGETFQIWTEAPRNWVWVPMSLFYFILFSIGTKRTINFWTKKWIELKNFYLLSEKTICFFKHTDILFISLWKQSINSVIEYWLLMYVFHGCCRNMWRKVLEFCYFPNILEADDFQIMKFFFFKGCQIQNFEDRDLPFWTVDPLIYKNWFYFVDWHQPWTIFLSPRL